MTTKELIHKTVKYLESLPEERVVEAADFVEYLYHKTDEQLLQKGIQKIMNDSESFKFLKNEEELYTVKDLKVKYN